MKNRSESARQLFKEGYNCTQAVVLAFADLIGKDENELAKVASSFGGGMGRLREVCGAVSGMAMVAGYLSGYSDPKDAEAKKNHYALIQTLAGEFGAETGSIVCKQLLSDADIPTTTEPTPDARTAEYYRKRPCADLVALAAGILEKHFC